MIKGPDLRLIQVVICFLFFLGTAAGHEAAVYFEPAGFAKQPELRYQSRCGSCSLQLSDSSLGMKFLDGSRLRMNLPHGTAEGLDPLPGTPGQTAARYSRIAYRSLFPGVDLLVY